MSTTTNETTETAVELSDDQNEAIEEIVARVRGGTQVTTLGGVAGTGKTTVIKELISVLVNVGVGAYTGKAVDVLHKKNVHLATTLHKHFYMPYRDKKDTLKFILRDRDLPSYEAFIVDEASMVPEWMFKDLKSLNIPLIFVGDHCQLPPIEGEFNIMTDPDIKLETLHRYAGELARFASHVRLGDEPTEFVPDANSLVTLVNSTSLWGTDPVEDLDTYQILVGTNRRRSAMNKHVRETVLKRQPGPEKGDRVIFLHNAHNIGVNNGQIAELRDWGDTHATVRTEDGRLQTFTHFGCFYGIPVPRKPDRSIGYLDYGYALTVHKAQGSEFDRVCVYDVNLDTGMKHILKSKGQLFRWRYTAATRAKKEIVWVY